jgi:hypothetical protein
MKLCKPQQFVGLYGIYWYFRKKIEITVGVFISLRMWVK